MPRIDPLQLLKCLSVLLSPDGGILTRDEVPRLVNLMTKFSKKLVSKSIYVLILKSTDTSLVDMFMAEGGWTLIETWIQDAVLLNNWVLVKEILELLLVTPVDVERLKMNCLPKLIKSLSRREDLEIVARLSDQIVQKWLTIVKGTAPSVQVQSAAEVAPQPQINAAVKVEASEPTHNVPIEPESVHVKEVVDENAGSIKPGTFYNSKNQDNKPVVDVPTDTEVTYNEVVTEKEDVKAKEVTPETDEVEQVKKADIKHDKHSKSPDSKSSKKSSSSSKKDKEKEKHRSSNSSSRSKSSSSSKEKDRKDKDKSDKERSEKDRSDKNKEKSDKDKSRDKKDKSRDKDRHSSSKSSSKSSSSHFKDHKDKSRDKDRSKDKEKDKEKLKDSKEKQAEKDKDTLAKIKLPTIDKLGKIPKKSTSANPIEGKEKIKDDGEVKKKPAFSILDKKKEGEERAKTVKVKNSKMRSTGLEEEVKPPPPRNALKKPTPSVQLPTIPQKRPSPIRDLSSSVPPEKKIKIDKIDVPERPGAIKLIPPKPKPMLQESDMFMDALSASVTKKPAKRKRRPSQSKETPSSPTSGPTEPTTPTSPTTTLSSPTIKHIAPINFYQDTLTEETESNSEETIKEEAKEKSDQAPQENNTESPASPSGMPGNEVEAEEEESAPKIPKLNEQGLKGVLLYSKKRGPKRSIRWKSEDDLVEVRYFELDETERVNVTRTFTDMAKMEMTSEREALLTRKPSFDDTMEPQTMWRVPFLCDLPEPSVIPGSKSLEKDIQFAREKSVLQALYFDKRRIPDSPEEPIPENHQMSDPVIIPLDDPEGQEIDLKTTPWPEPKGMAIMEQQQLPPVFNQNMPFNQNYMGGPQFAGMPQRFAPPAGPPQIPPMGGNFGPPMGNMMGPPNMMTPDMVNQGYMPGPHHDAYPGPGPESYPGGPPPFNGPPGPNMNVAYGPPGNYNNYRGPRGPFRRGGGNNPQGGWVRMSAPSNNNWKRGGGGGRGPNNNRVCKNITNHGYCRNGDKCQWFHPQ